MSIGDELGWHRECQDADDVLRHLGLNPEQCRTDGGWLNLARIKTLLAEKTESQAAQIAALTAERDALRADANRYRAAKVNGSHNIAVCEWDGDEWVALDPRMVDSRVDAAIKGQTP